MRQGYANLGIRQRHPDFRDHLLAELDVATEHLRPIACGQLVEHVLEVDIHLVPQRQVANAVPEARNRRKLEQADEERLHQLQEVDAFERTSARELDGRESVRDLLANLVRDVVASGEDRCEAEQSLETWIARHVGRQEREQVVHLVPRVQ